MEASNFVYEVTEGEEVSAQCRFKNWSENHEKFLPFVQLATCPLEVDFGTELGVVKLSFFLQTFTDQMKQEVQKGRATGNYETSHYLSLYIAVLRGSGPLSFHLKTEITTGERNLAAGNFSDVDSTVQITSDEIKDAKLISDTFIKYKQEIMHSNRLVIRTDRPAFKEFKIKISVIPNVITGTKNGPSTSSDDQESSIFTELRAMYASEHNFSDLKLEMRDNMTLSAHKFIVCARSEVFKELVMKEVARKGYDGTIQMPQVNAKPMMAILHWMYTGELQENAGNFMMEIVEAAINFRLIGMMKILDKKLISICTRENMFHLYQVAEKNALPTAKTQLSQYIKENV